MTLVSVVIPVRDGARYLSEAIESALAQEDTATEVIVVDDGSSDDSAAVALRYAADIRLLRRGREGGAAARNAGVQCAGGSHIAFLDADDVLPPHSIAWRMESMLDTSSPPELVWGRVRCFTSPDLSVDERRRVACPAEPLAGRLPGTLLMRRSTFERIGPMPTHLRVGEFIAWAARGLELRLVERDIDDVVLHRRLHRTNLGRTQRDARGDYARLLKEMLDRRRATAESA